MNLSLEWLSLLEKRGWDICHWANIGKINATDIEIFS